MPKRVGFGAATALTSPRLPELLAVRRGVTLVLGTASLRSSWWRAVGDEVAGAAAGVEIEILSANPALPAFGPPGAVTLARKRLAEPWQIVSLEALCTLNAGRFRLPLLTAVKRLRTQIEAPRVLVDAPSVTRGMAGSELVAALVEELAIETVVLLGADAELPQSVAARPAIEVLRASGPERSSSAERQLERSNRWIAHLDGATETRLDLGRLSILGAPPPEEAPEAWAGRQLAALDASGATLVLGECVARNSKFARLLAPPFPVKETRALLVRDARRELDGARHLRTIATVRAAADNGAFTSVSDLDGAVDSDAPHPRVTSLSTAKAVLVNGIFGDPLLHIRLRHQRRSLLFDLGDSARLPARIVHQVTDVFITHAHFDHIGGFLWFLRSCIGSPRPRRIFGPPGIADHLAAMIAGIRWDRVGARGPVFEVTEVHRDRLERHRLRAGEPAQEPLERVRVGDRETLPIHVLLDEPELEVRAVELDHGIPVLAFAFRERQVLNVRKERLLASGLAPGAWIGTLKQAVHAGELDVPVPIPGGEARRAGDLADELLLARPGRSLVYATDFDDSEANRRALTGFARGATYFYCESSFREKDRDLARATQHSTTAATAAIAAAAEVARLVPFHFSKRYESEPEAVYAELESRFPGRIVRIEPREVG